MLAIARATDKEGFGICENPKCRARVPKLYVDHVTPIGKIDAGFIERLWCPSKKLQAWCRRCHAKKTREEAKARAEEEKKTKWEKEIK